MKTKQGLNNKKKKLDLEAKPVENHWVNLDELYWSQKEIIWTVIVLTGDRIQASSVTSEYSNIELLMCKPHVCYTMQTTHWFIALRTENFLPLNH